MTVLGNSRFRFHRRLCASVKRRAMRRAMAEAEVAEAGPRPKFPRLDPTAAVVEVAIAALLPEAAEAAAPGAAVLVQAAVAGIAR